MKRIKILRIIARLNIGGPAIHTILLTEGLDKSRFESVLVCGMPEEGEGDMLYLAEEKGVRTIIIPELGRALNIRNDISAFWKLFCLIKREKPDIVHTHTAKAGTLGRLAGLLYKFSSKLEAQRSKVRLVHTFHGHVLHSYFGRMKSGIFVWIERFLAVFTHRIIAVSESVREELVRLKIAGHKKIIAISLGLELEKYLKIENNGFGNKDYKSIGIIGRLVPIKNHKMFLDVAKLLLEAQGLKLKVDFIITGNGKLRQDLEKYAGELGLEDNVTFTGWQKDLDKLYSNLDIVALTSLNEGTPVALIEAQAAARPCVATNVGGVGDILGQRAKGKGSGAKEDDRLEITERGVLVGSQDAEGFAQGLALLLKDTGLSKKMGKAGREFVRERFSKDRLVRDIERLYLEIRKGRI